MRLVVLMSAHRVAQRQLLQRLMNGRRLEQVEDALYRDAFSVTDLQFLNFIKSPQVHVYDERCESQRRRYL